TLVDKHDVLNQEQNLSDGLSRNSLQYGYIKQLNSINRAYDRLFEAKSRDVIREIYILGRPDYRLIKKLGVSRGTYYGRIKPEALLQFAAAFDNGRLIETGVADLG
ncbi:DUF1492 domain-containing protein, partial [Lentilactobacillus kefiri]|uniref:DUF1492 domain-containing protein n=1 Tax=Lentilactobacillus kefiri TaxID=33962 RepID=UPI000BC52075